MIPALVAAALLAVSGGDRPPVARPHNNVRTRPPAKPQPPPPPAEDDPSDDDADAPPPGDRLDPPSRDDVQPLREKDDLTDEQAGAVVLGTACCCFVFAAVVGVVIYFIVRKKPGAKTAATPGFTSPPAPGAAPYAAPQAPPQQQAPFHLSVLAIGLNASARETIAQQLLLSGVSTAPASAAERAHLVRELAKALRSNELAWSHFGYGERLDLFDEGSAARSYQLAVDDFRQRSDQGSLSGDATFVVATLVLCTRRQLRGVASLSDRDQIRTMLEDRVGLLEHELMGAFLVWSAPLAGAEVVARFPEMHVLQ